jgi:hypothetical protein
MVQQFNISSLSPSVKQPVCDILTEISRHLCLLYNENTMGNVGNHETSNGSEASCCSGCWGGAVCCSCFSGLCDARTTSTYTVPIVHSFSVGQDSVKGNGNLSQIVAASKLPQKSNSTTNSAASNATNNRKKLDLILDKLLMDIVDLICSSLPTDQSEVNADTLSELSSLKFGDASVASSKLKQTTSLGTHNSVDSVSTHKSIPNSISSHSNFVHGSNRKLKPFSVELMILLGRCWHYHSKNVRVHVLNCSFRI